MNDPHEALRALTQMRLDAELAKLKRFSEETHAFQREIALLGDALEARAAGLKQDPSASDLALAYGCDALWQNWVANQKQRLTREAAEAAARREAQKMKAQRAFGQAEALTAIRRLENEERRLRIARSLADDPDQTNGAR